jgi:uracil-DNA glycosylase
MEKVDEEYKLHACYPPKDLVFSAFNYCSFNNEVVIIGQDPYHGREANGLAFCKRWNTDTTVVA